MKRSVSFLALLLFPFPLFAFETKLVDSHGAPVAYAQVSVAGQSGAFRTDAAGRVTIEPDPQLPATLVVIGSRGELFPPVRLESLAAELHLAATYRESVTVTSGATPNIEVSPAAAQSVIGAEELDERKPTHVADALVHIAGASLRGEGPPAVPIVRGLGGGRTMLLFDDAPIVAERRAGPSATFLDPFLLGTIEVARGPGGSAYGSDAFGGIVHFRPRDPVPGESSYRVDAWTAAGGESTASVGAEISTDLLGGALLAAIHARSAGTADDAEGDAITPSSFRDRGAMLRFVRDSDLGRFRVGLISSIARDIGAPSSEATKTSYPDERSTFATFAFDARSISVRASLGTYAITTLRGAASSTVKSRDASFRITSTRNGSRSRLVTGADFVSRFDLRATGSVVDADRADFGIFTTYERRLAPRWLLHGGVRVDQLQSRNRGGFAGDRDRSGTALSGHAAVSAGPLKGVIATLQVASGYREPTLSDRYFRGVSGRGFVTGNPELHSERSTQLDAAVRWSGKYATLAVFGYDYRIRDLVERYRSGADFLFRNRGEANVRGVELEATAHLPRSFDVILAAASARGEDADTGAALDDIAAPSVHVTLRWANARASAFVTTSLFTDDDEPGPLEVVRDGHANVELGAGWHFTPRVELRAVLRNATNGQHFGSADAASAFAPGRTIVIGIGVRQ